MDKVDALMIGGGMTYTFMKAMGGTVGDSICENDKLDLAKEILEKAKNKEIKIYFPMDSVCAKEIKEVKEIEWNICISSKKVYLIGASLWDDYIYYQMPEYNKIGLMPYYRIKLNDMRKI